MTEIAVELLVGRVVRDSAGRRAGRIRELMSDDRHSDCIISSVQLGHVSILQWLARSLLGRELHRALGGQRGISIVPWNMIDLSDPSRPRLRCRREELPRVAPDPPHDDTTREGGLP